MIIANPSMRQKRGRPKMDFKQRKPWEMFKIMAEYCTSKKVIPTKKKLWEFVVKPQRPISWTGFRKHWDDLEDAGYISIDQMGAVMFKDAELYIHTE